MNEPSQSKTKAKSGSQKRQRSKMASMPCTPDELEDIKSRAEKLGLQVSGYLRRLIFGKETIQPRAARRPVVEKEELVKLRFELRKIGGDLSQIAQHMNQKNEFDALAYKALAMKHESILDAIIHVLGLEPKL